MSRHDWYTLENLIASGDLLPMDLVYSETQSPGDASTSRGMATTVRSSDRMDIVAHEPTVMQHDPNRGAA